MFQYDKSTDKFRLKEHKDDINKAAGILLVDPNGKILLQRRSDNVPAPGTLGTTGGHLCKGESPQEGALREFEEETDYSGPFNDMVELATQTGPTSYTTFLAKTPEKSPDFKAQEEFVHEVAGYTWVSIDELKNTTDLHPGLQELISEYYDDIKNFIGEK